MKLQKMMGYSNRSAAAVKSGAIKSSQDMAAREPTNKKALALRNLGPNDVVFGTKGNGRNESFLACLEEHAAEYVSSSKFVKMSLVQKLIRDWKGNFYFLNPKTNELSLARENKANEEFDSDDEEAGLPSTSSKLYTSVRRMVNYVVSKGNYSYAEAAASSTASPKRKNSTSKSNKKRKESFDVPATVAAPLKKAKKSPKKAASTSVAAPAPVPRTDTLSPLPTMMGNNKRVPMLVTPEPSPRTQQLLSPVSFQEGETAVHHASARNNAAIAFPTTFVSSPIASNGVLRPMSSRTVSSTELVPRKNHLSEKYVGRLEDNAVAALISLSSASWTEGEEQPVGLYF